MAAITNVDIATGAGYTAVATTASSRPLTLINASAAVMTIRLGGAGDTVELDPGEKMVVPPKSTVEAKHNASGNRTLTVLRGVALDENDALRAPMGTPAIKTAVTVGATTTELLAANAVRTHAIIKADSANTEAISLAIGESAVDGEGIVLDPGDALQLGPLNWTGAAINGICASGGMTARVWEA